MSGSGIMDAEGCIIWRLKNGKICDRKDDGQRHYGNIDLSKFSVYGGHMETL